MFIALAVLVVSACCPNERDQLQIAVTVADWPQAGMDCASGCGFDLGVTMLPEVGDSPRDVEQILVGGVIVDSGAPTVELTYAWDIDQYNFPDAYARASFDLAVANSVGASVVLSSEAVVPSDVGPPPDPALSGSECNILELVEFEAKFEGSEAILISGGNDTAGG